MSNFCPDQGRSRVYGEAYYLYAAAENPRKTQIRAKRAIYGWKLTNALISSIISSGVGTSPPDFPYQCTGRFP
jgi:hypothetical protein